jgi:hypothetical protein
MGTKKILANCFIFVYTLSNSRETFYGVFMTITSVYSLKLYVVRFRITALPEVANSWEAGMMIKSGAYFGIDILLIATLLPGEGDRLCTSRLSAPEERIVSTN